MGGNGYLGIFSRPQAIENSRQYLLFRTDILQKTVVGCPLRVMGDHQYLSNTAAMSDIC